jgi:DNA-binding transcriptional ArsR family regulator
MMSFQKTFHALSDPTRREILARLKKGVMSAGEIAEGFQMTAATVSHHLSVLKEAQLVTDRRDGKYIYYELNTSVIEDILTWFADLKGENDEKN